MSTVQEIVAAAEKLPRKQFFSLVEQLRVRHADEWDRQIRQDARSGRLDALYARLEAENRGQPEVPLDEVVDEG